MSGHPQPAEGWIPAALEDLRAHNLLRTIRQCPGVGGRLCSDGRTLLNFSSNDYLDLARHPAVLHAAEEHLRRYGAGATASRLVTGGLPCHAELEAELAAWKGYPAALLFGSGYLANLGVLGALAEPGDVVFADRLSHASLLRGAQASGARLRRFRHNDVEHLEHLLRESVTARRRLVVTESVFSMDGDLAPLAAIAAAAARAGSLLLVDEAHAVGVFGEAGAGRVHALGLQQAVSVCIGTLSKGLGAYGGYVACSAPLRDWLVNRAATVTYTTALPPAAVGAARGALGVLRAEPARGAPLLPRAAALRARLAAAGLDTGASASQIVPVLLGGEGAALRASAMLEAEGILAVAIRPPTVPRGSVGPPLVGVPSPRGVRRPSGGLRRAEALQLLLCPVGPPLVGVPSPRRAPSHRRPPSSGGPTASAPSCRAAARRRAVPSRSAASQWRPPSSGGPTASALSCRAAARRRAVPSRSAHRPSGGLRRAEALQLLLRPVGPPLVGVPSAVERHVRRPAGRGRQPAHRLVGERHESRRGLRIG
jgi:8-amino-7-oxononanoate synthase